MRAIAPAVTAFALLAAASTLARADEKAECSASYAETQSLRRAGKLAGARERVVVCMRDACAPFIRSDCAKWFAESEAAQPTVVLDVKDARGNDASAVRVTLDGHPWIDGLDGKARPLDPGSHTLRFEMPGARPVEQTLEAREGDKGRRVSVRFVAAAEDFTVARDRPSRSPAPWILGGVGATSPRSIAGRRGSASSSSALKSTFDALLSWFDVRFAGRRRRGLDDPHPRPRDDDRARRRRRGGRWRGGLARRAAERDVAVRCDVPHTMDRRLGPRRRAARELLTCGPSPWLRRRGPRSRWLRSAPASSSRRARSPCPT